MKRPLDQAVAYATAMADKAAPGAVATAARALPADDGDPSRPVTFDEVRLLALAEIDHHAIWRDHLLRQGEHRHAATHQRRIDVYQRIAAIAERCGDPVIFRRLAELAAEARAMQAQADADATGEEGERVEDRVD